MIIISYLNFESIVYFTMKVFDRAEYEQTYIFLNKLVNLENIFVYDDSTICCKIYDLIYINTHLEK